MKHIRFIALISAFALLLAAFSACGKKNVTVIGEDSAYPCEITFNGTGCVISLPSKTGYSWKTSAESGRGFELEPLKADDKKTEFSVTAGDPGIIDTLTLTLEKDGAPVPMAAFETKISLLNENGGGMSVFASTYRELTGDVLYGGDSSIPYILQAEEDGDMRITLLKNDEQAHYAVELEPEGILGVSYGGHNEQTQELVVFASAKGSAKLYVGAENGKETVLFTVTADPETGVEFSEGSIENYGIAEKQNNAAKEELDDLFGKIAFPDGCGLVSCEKKYNFNEDGERCVCAVCVLELSGGKQVGYMIYSDNSAEYIRQRYASDGSERIKLGDISAYGFALGNGSYALTWNSSEGNSAFIVSAEKEEDALAAAEKLAQLNTAVKENPGEPLTEPETSAEEETATEAPAETETAVTDENETVPQEETEAN